LNRQGAKIAERRDRTRKLSFDSGGCPLFRYL